MSQAESAARAKPADEWLVQRALEGDHRAFDMLVIKYQSRVQRLIARWVKDSAWAEDLTQETFIKAYQALPQFRGEAKFYTWLYRIAVNAAKKHLSSPKHRMHAHSLEIDADDEETFSARSDSIESLVDHNSPEAMLASQEIARAVQAALQALPEDLRQAVSLREMDGMSYDDIAQTMACPIGTVRSRIFRAREAIAQAIRPMLAKQTGKRW